MPYRRLPNTDQARLKALRQALESVREADYTEQVLSYKTVNQAQRFLTNFEMQVSTHHQTFEGRVTANKKYRHVVQTARMYISHFIQVLNLSVIRGEIKKEMKELYHLSTTSHVLPDLFTEEDILVWGQNIIDGELERTQMGGFPIYNPTISKVKVYYEIFKEQYVTLQRHRANTDKTQQSVESLRAEADEIILDIWNQVEAYFDDLYPYEKMQRCKHYGMKFYYRPDEKRLTPETDIALKKKTKMMSPKLELPDE